MSTKIRVLVVDDQEPVREAVTALLNESGRCDVIAQAVNGRDAVTCVADEEPDAILMDLRMPVMDGVEATRAIRASGHNVPVLIHSAYGDDSLVLDALQAGARGYIVKGSAMSDVVSALELVVAGESHISDEVTRPLIRRLVDALAIERRTREEAERAAEIIARATEQQKEFAIQVSHELRTPLTSLLGSLEMLDEPCGELGLDITRSLVSGALEGARRFGRLTANLEVIATGDAVSIVPQAAALAPLIGDVVRDLKAWDRVSIDVGGHCVIADPSRVKQVVYNLLENALALRADDPRVEVNAAIENERVVIRVADRGPGFDPMVREELFEAFHHPSGSASGLGVGLAVVKRLVERMDGSIAVDDRPGGGATVSVAFPVAYP